MNLMQLATGYLETLGYTMGQRGKNLLVGHRLSIGGKRDTILVWVPDLEPGESFTSQEGQYRDQFASVPTDYPGVQRKFMLVETAEGIRPKFVSRAVDEHDVHILVPIDFFDSPFKWEQPIGRKAASAALKVKRQGDTWARRRVPQPYTVNVGTEMEAKDDILDALINSVVDGFATRLNLVIGPAGIGKTVLFEALFSNLYSVFQTRKSQHRVFRRPLPLMPEYFREAIAPTLVGLTDAFVRSEFAARIERSTFEWMLANGFGVWLIDGLDELVDRDPEFLSYLLEIFTMPGSADPVVMFFLRDSVFATNDDLTAFYDNYPDDITIYELSRWKMRSKRALAKIKLRGKQPDRFVNILTTHRDLDNLSEIPYYCDLMLEEYKAGLLEDKYTEAELLGRALLKIIEREYKKKLLDPVVLPTATVRELLQDLASVDFAGGWLGLTRETVKEYTEIVLPSDLGPQEAKEMLANMVQHAVFSRAPGVGSVRFAQEIQGHYLLGERFSRNFRTNEGAFLQELSQQLIPSQWVTLGVVAEDIRKQRDAGKLLQLLQQPNLCDTTFRNLVQIAAYAVEDPDALGNIPFEGRNLCGVTFRDLSFHGVSFRGCNLRDVEFNRCLLQGAKFQHAIIDRTAFLHMDRPAMEGAQFCDIEFSSLRTPSGRLETEYSRAKKWLRDRTGEAPEIFEPCPAARQLHYLFGKFLDRSGDVKSNRLEKQMVLTGKRFCDAEETFEAAIRYGYLIRDPARYRQRVWRNREPTEYSEMCDYIRDWVVSKKIRVLLDEICTVRKCQHVPPRPGR